MNLVWKLLRQHISIGQFTGFTLANLAGMLIILCGIQFYQDVSSIFSSRESFMKKDYIIVTRRVGTLAGLTGQTSSFSRSEVDKLRQQPFAKSVGEFMPADYKVSASMGMRNVGIQFSTEMFFECVSDEYVDYNSKQWKYTPGDRFIPIILPRNYLNLYNFGFAQTRGLPKISEGVIGMISLDIAIRGERNVGQFVGRIVGFSNRLNTILVPQSFMTWANAEYGSGKETAPSRLILEVYNPADDAIAKYFQENHYETEDDKLEQGKTTWFLKIVVGIVMGVGVLITVLALYILMLSIYLLVQKNTGKLENLLLIGYSPSQVARPYQLLTVGLNTCVLVLTLVALAVIRGQYLHLLQQLYPDLLVGSVLPAAGTGIVLFLLVSLLNIWIIRQKVRTIWKQES